MVCNQYPLPSETFVSGHVDLLMRDDWRVAVHATEILSSDVSGIMQSELYGEGSSILERIRFLAAHLMRASVFMPKALKHALHHKLYRQLLSGRILHRALSTRNLNEDTLVHVHFLNQAEAIAEMKSAGFLTTPIIATAHGFDVNVWPKQYEKEDAFKFLKITRVPITCGSEFIKKKLVGFGIPEHQLFIIPFKLCDSAPNYLKKNSPLV